MAIYIHIYRYIHIQINNHIYIYREISTYVNTYVHIYIIIIIIISRCQHGSPCSSLATLLYRPSLLGGGFQAISCIVKEMLYIGSSWLSGLCSPM